MQTYILLHEAYSVRLRCGGVRSCKASDIGNSRKDIIPLADTYVFTSFSNHGQIYGRRADV